MSFHGCGDELAALRRAAEASVGPFGLPGVAGSAEGTAYPAGRAAGAPTAAGADAPASAAPAAAPAYSGTNDYQAGVDEPDLVKTDGRRIVTVAGGVLQVIDAASRTVTGRLDLDAVGAGIGYQPATCCSAATMRCCSAVAGLSPCPPAVPRRLSSARGCSLWILPGTRG
jgi:hypothetical protein